MVNSTRGRHRILKGMLENSAPPRAQTIPVTIGRSKHRQRAYELKDLNVERVILWIEEILQHLRYHASRLKLCKISSMHCCSI